MSKATIGALIVLVLIVSGYFAFKGDKSVDTLDIYNNNATEVKLKVPTNINKDLGETSSGTNSTASASASKCSVSKGTWSAEYKECNGISENTCKAIGGTYDGCASACRHDPKAEMCTMQCVQVCTLN